MNIVQQHIMESVQAAKAELDGNEEWASRLRARCKLRLVSMSDVEIWELAEFIGSLSESTPEQVYKDFRCHVEYYQATGADWVNELTQTGFIS